MVTEIQAITAKETTSCMETSRDNRLVFFFAAAFNILVVPFYESSFRYDSKGEIYIKMCTQTKELHIQKIKEKLG